MPRPPKYSALAPAALAASPKNLFVGTSGWSYATWKPQFYPPEVPSRAFLQYYSSRFTTVEVNHTFRKLPEPTVLQSWLEATPPGFRFSFKAPEQMTHRKRLVNCHDGVEEFVEAIRPAHAAGKLGALLFQLPPNFKANLERLLDILAAPALGSRTDRLPVAVEFRNATWFTEETYAILRAHSAALCVADSNDLATPDIVTGPFRYYRFRKDGGYASRVLSSRAKNLGQAAQTSEVFVYLKHEDEPTGALDALSLIERALSFERSKGPAA